MNQFGEKIKKLRVKRGLLQREIAYELGMDTPMLSKIERGERNAKREQVEILCTIFKVPLNDLLSLWLADKVFEVVKGEDVALKALAVTENELKGNSIRKGKN
ncbi:MAG: transcriptional regulator [Flavobacterium sp. BFFFF2]|nr:MAG: transcriptional regulator [Flavobacterium sp. BFFFF2]